jgi:hypothetical protein
MRAEAEARAAVILHDLAPLRHRRERHARLQRFRSQEPGAIIRGGEERERLIAQALNRPCGFPARKAARPVNSRVSQRCLPPESQRASLGRSCGAYAGAISLRPR